MVARCPGRVWWDLRRAGNPDCRGQSEARARHAAGQAPPDV